MSVVQTLIGNVKGPQGATGATGATGPQGDAATVNVGSVSTTAYGNPAQVVNVGTENEAILNFVIPQGRPGQATTTMGGLTLDTITTSTADFPSPQVGDTGATAFGKIVKFFADALSALNSKLNAANVVNNLTTTEAGYALDARAGKTLNDSLVVTHVTATLETQNKYTIANPHMDRIGKLMIFSALVTVVTPVTSYGGQQIISNAPEPVYGFTTIFTSWSNVTTTGNNLRVYVNAGGTIGLRDGLVNNTYDVMIAYPLA